MEVEIHARRNFHLKYLGLVVSPVVILTDGIKHHRLDSEDWQFLFLSHFLVPVGVVIAPVILGLDAVEPFRPARMYRVVP
jgi:hypothetical protein